MGCDQLLALDSISACLFVCLINMCVRSSDQLCLTFCESVDNSPSASSVHGILQLRILEWVVVPSPGGLPDPGIKSKSLVSLVLQADSLPLVPPGKLHLLKCETFIGNLRFLSCILILYFTSFFQ